MNLTFSIATMQDFPAVCAFYKEVIEKTDMEHAARWVYGKHPSDRMIRDYIEDGCIVLAKRDDTIVSAMAQTKAQGADYHPIPWSQTLCDGQVSVIHLLCVHPAFSGQGIGRAMIAHAVNRAKEMGKAAIRLDCLSSNTSANAMYEHLGFAFRGTQVLFADNLGDVLFRYYELNLN